MQPRLQPSHNLKMFPGRRGEDDLKARGTFSCCYLPVPQREKTLPAPAPSATREHPVVPSSSRSAQRWGRSSADLQPPKCC